MGRPLQIGKSDNQALRGSIFILPILHTRTNLSHSVCILLLTAILLQDRDTMGNKAIPFCLYCWLLRDRDTMGNKAIPFCLYAPRSRHNGEQSHPILSVLLYTADCEHSKDKKSRQATRRTNTRRPWSTTKVSGWDPRRPPDKPKAARKSTKSPVNSPVSRRPTKSNVKPLRSNSPKEQVGKWVARSAEDGFSGLSGGYVETENLVLCCIMLLINCIVSYLLPVCEYYSGTSHNGPSHQRTTSL